MNTPRVVTLNDILVEIVGDVPSADELEEPQAVQREDGSWLLDGMLPVGVLNFRDQRVAWRASSYQTWVGL